MKLRNSRILRLMFVLLRNCSSGIKGLKIVRNTIIMVNFVINALMDLEKIGKIIVFPVRLLI